MVYIGDCINPTLTAINGLEKEVSPISPRLGMSQIGHPCIRYLWYTFHWCYENKLDKRIIRLFKRGAREEPEVYEELEKIGILIYGKQERVLAVNGHFKGKIDGVALKVLEAPKTPHLLEIKTMAHKYFTPLTKKGVKESKPDYYAQVQIYMLKMKLKRTLFIAVNKNDDEWYIERINIDTSFAKDLERKARYIIVEAGEPPKKPFSSSWWQCKNCNAQSICHGKEKAERNCRTCKYAGIADEGKWFCDDEFELATDQQRIGCPDYKVLTCLKK